MLSIGRSQVSPSGHIFWLPALIGSQHAAHAHISFAKSYMLTPSLPSLTGSGESGKLTIVKQMNIIHQSGISWEEFLIYRTTNLVNSVQAIILAMRKIWIDHETPSNWVSILRFCRFHWSFIWLLCIFTFLCSCTF